MAKKRMFSLDVIDTDLFLEMPPTSRLLYYDFCMRADDDGFVSSPKKIIKMIGCSNDDLKILIAKNYVIPFDSGIVVITHWKINNYIPKDRYKETIYTDEKKLINQDVNGLYTTCIQNVYSDKIRLDKNSIDKNSIDVVVSNNNINNNNIIKSYEENIGMITPATAELLFSYLDDFAEDVIIKAINIASINNKRNAKYIAGILNDWNRKGFKNLLDIENAENSFDNKKNKNETDEERLARKIKEMEEYRKQNGDE